MSLSRRSGGQEGQETSVGSSVDMCCCRSSYRGAYRGAHRGACLGIIAACMMQLAVAVADADDAHKQLLKS